MSDLLKQIDDLVASKTFNLDALDGIKKLKDDLQKTLTEVSMLNDRNKALLREVEDLKAGNKTNTERITFLNSLVEANQEAAKKGQQSIYEAEKHKAVAEAWKEAMQTVFKPNTVRETVFQSMPISQSSGGATFVSNYQQETRTTKEEL